MASAYWAQWSPAELISMQGVELDDYHNDDHDDCNYEIEVQDNECKCTTMCMDCLGLSWRDFM